LGAVFPIGMLRVIEHLIFDAQPVLPIDLGHPVFQPVVAALLTLPFPFVVEIRILLLADDIPSLAIEAKLAIDNAPAGPGRLPILPRPASKGLSIKEGHRFPRDREAGDQENEERVNGFLDHRTASIVSALGP